MMFFFSINIINTGSLQFCIVLNTIQKSIKDITSRNKSVFLAFQVVKFRWAYTVLLIV